MKASELMSTTVFCLEEDAPIGAAIQLVSEQEVRHVPVLRDGRLVGVLSDRDLRRVEGLVAQTIGAAQVSRGALEAPVSELLSGGPVWVERSASADEVIDRLLEEHVGAVVVVDAERRPVGIVSYTDVLRAARGRLG